MFRQDYRINKIFLPCRKQGKKYRFMLILSILFILSKKVFIENENR